LTLPQAFLAADGVLRLALNIATGLVVNREVIRRNVDEAFPFMATENVLMAAVAAGGDRQGLHERIRQHSMEAANRLKAGTRQNDLLDRLRADPAFANVDFQSVLQKSNFVGRAAEQVQEWLAEEIEPVRTRYASLPQQKAEIHV